MKTYSIVEKSNDKAYLYINGDLVKIGNIDYIVDIGMDLELKNYKEVLKQ